MNDQHAAFLEQRLVAIEIEVITQTHHLNEQRIQNRIDVVRRNVRNAGDQNVALAAHRNRILFKSLGNNLLVHRFGLAGMTGDHLVLRRPRMQQLSPGRPRQLAHRVAHGFKLHAIKGGEVVFVLEQKIHVAFVHAIVDGGLDVKNVQMLIDNLAQADGPCG